MPEGMAVPAYQPTYCVQCRASDNRCGLTSLALQSPCCEACQHVGLAELALHDAGLPLLT